MALLATCVRSSTARLTQVACEQSITERIPSYGSLMKLYLMELYLVA